MGKLARRTTSTEKNKFEKLRAIKMLQLLFPGKYEGAVLSDTPDMVAKESDTGVIITVWTLLIARKQKAKQTQLYRVCREQLTHYSLDN